MSAPLATLRGLSHRFGPAAPPALDGLTAAIHPGRITGLVGPDGAGKTTLLRLLAGLLRPSAGEIRACGLDPVRQAEELREQLGYMPQKFGLYEDLTVQENLRLYADLRGLDAAERGPAFERLLAFTDLAAFTDRLAGRLSGGMKQKLGLACTLLRKPRLLLLDEPSVGVDPVSRRELWRMVSALVDDRTAVVWSTAYLDEAEACDEVLLLSDGRLLFDGPPAELTGRLAGRSLLLRDLGDSRRRVLTTALQQPEVRDGVVQGSSLRLVLADGAARPDLPRLGAPASTQVEVVTPRFEDAFVDILGGGPGGASPLAAATGRRPADGGAVVEARGLTKRFGDFTAARDIDFTIGRGEIFGLLGPNGAGKSTTFKMLCGLLRPSAGSGRVAGYDLLHASAQARSRLGYMAQKFSLYGDLSVRQNLDFFSGVYGLQGAARRQAVAQMIDTFTLTPHLRDSAQELPLGFKQRLALACSLMHGPDVLFLDEPTSGVDPLTRREFWTHINALVEQGVTVLVTTHFMDEAEYCDRIALIYRGEAIATGTPDDLKGRVADSDHPEPTLEDAFIALLQRHDAEAPA